MEGKKKKKDRERKKTRKRWRQKEDFIEHFDVAKLFAGGVQGSLWLE